MRKHLLFIALLLIPSRCFAQGSAYTAGPFSSSGWLYVCPVPSGGTPCPSPSSIFSNAALTTPITQPLFIPAGSTVSFFLAGGQQYTVQFPATGYSQIVGAGGGVSPNSPALGGAVYATQLAANAGQTLFMDTQDAGLNGCSLAGSPAVVTCTTNTFTCPADTGKIIWAVNTATPGALALADSTIVTCTDAKHVTASTNTVISGAVSNLRFGHDDTAAWDAVNTAYNTLILTAPVCLLTPSGMSTVKHGTLLINPTTGYNNTGQFATCFRSIGTTYFSPVPDFNFYFYNAAGTNIQFMDFGLGACCKAGSPEPNWGSGIMVDGAGLNSGTGVCAVGASPQTSMFLSQAHTEKVGVIAWCGGVSNFTAPIIDNLGTITDLESINVGQTGPTIQGSNPSNPANIIGGRSNCDPGQIYAINIGTSVNTRSVAFTCGRTLVNFAAGASTVVWHSEHDSFFQSPAGQTRQGISVTTGTAWISDCWAQGSTGNPMIQTQGSGIVHVKGCTFNMAANQFWGDTHTVAGGTCYDDGGNNIIGSFASDCIPTTSNGIWGVGTGVATANTTLFLVAPAATTTLFTNTTATTSSGVAPFTGTLANLVCVSTAAGVNASSGVVTVRLAPLSTGTFAASTLTATFGTTTSAKDQTHTVAITQGQPIQFQVTTQLAETLAGVQCRVSEY